MSWLVATDLHLSSRPKDGYRFGIFSWLAKQQKQYNTTATFLLGDLTQEKDNHSATLVNRTIDELTRLRPPVFILRGNHDGLRPDDPFFRFTNCIDGINFIVDPCWLPDFQTAMIPHCRTQAEFDEACKLITPKTCAMVHQTFEGAIAESGVVLSGLNTAELDKRKLWGVYAGDVHKPQTQGVVVYVGAPYHVRFGDSFVPRVLLLDEKLGAHTDLHFVAPRKWVVRTSKAHEIKGYDLRPGDQVKIILELGREEAIHWHHHRRAALGLCRDMKLEVFGIDLKVKSELREPASKQPQQLKSHDQIMAAFCKHEGITGEVRSTGTKILQANEPTGA